MSGRSRDHAVLRPVSVRIGAALWLAPVTPPLISLFRSSVPTAVEGLTIGVAAAACVHPALAIGLAAALLPLGITLGAALQIPFTEPLALAVIAGIAVRYLIAPRPLPDGAGPVLAWTAVLAVLAAASAAVDCAAQLALYPSAGSLARDVWQTLSVQYLFGASRFTALRPALTTIEGLGLLTAAIVSIDRTRHSALVAMLFLLGASAVSVQNIVRLCQIALRSGGEFWPTLAADLMAVRVSAAFPDLNTAGSYLVMAVVMAFVWRCRRRAVWISLSIPLLAVALWISGSRAALAAAPLALAVALAPRRGRWWFVGSLAALSVVALFATQWFRTTTAPGSALFIRVELVKAGLAMLRDAPVFGVGIGNFYDTSERYVSPELAHFYVRENAHNQYMQIAAELGLTGLVAFLAILVLVFRRGIRDRPRPDALRDAVLAGLLAFLLSAIGGHPLLIPEVALAFWIVVGLAWASSEGEVQARSPQRALPARPRAVLAIALAGVALATPWRVERAAAALPLEHVGVRMSPWQRDEQGRRFRTMRGHAAIYVPATGGPVRFLARIGNGGPEELRLRLSFDGRLVNEVRLSREWRPVDLIVPREGNAPFRRLGLDLAGPGGAAADAAADIGIVQQR
jgi:O-antigen ligase